MAVEPIDVWCPYCGAMPPEHCTTKRGLRADTPHQARIDRAATTAPPPTPYEAVGAAFSEAANRAADAMTAFGEAWKKSQR